MSKFHIKKVSEVDKEKLFNFYQNSFNFDKDVLQNYTWRYRLNYQQNLEPLVLIVDNEICGHAGLMPVDLKIDNKSKKAIWFTDFFINKKYRSLGYGKLLTEAWMEICPIQITLCNNRSLKIFKKLNWSYNNNFIRNINLYNYLNIFPIFRKLDRSENLINCSDNLKLIELNNQNLSKIIRISEEMLSKKSIGIIRDESWFKWRILDCPYKKDILVFSYNGEYLIAHIKKKNNLKILNIIYSSKFINQEIINLFLNFSKNNKIDYMAYISHESKKNKLINLNLPWNKKINFAFFSKNNLDLKSFDEKFDDIQFIDSDIDYI